MPLDFFSGRTEAGGVKMGHIGVKKGSRRGKNREKYPQNHGQNAEIGWVKRGRGNRKNAII